MPRRDLDLKSFMFTSTDSSLAFVVWAPAYNILSGGTVALHGLAEDMHRLGCNVFIYSPKLIPGARTPLIDDFGISELRKEGIIVVAIYPEIIVKNVLHADYVIWWLLHFPGFHLNNWSGDRSWIDRIVCFHPDLAVECGAQAKLTFPLYDPAFFRPRSDYKRSEIILYVNRIRGFTDFHYEIPLKPTRLLKPEDSLSYSELREIFWRTKTLISFEWSGTLKIAKMCGVPILYVESPIFRRDGFHLSGGYGHAWEISEEAVIAAERTVHLEYLLAIETLHAWQPSLVAELRVWFAEAKLKGRVYS